MTQYEHTVKGDIMLDAIELFTFAATLHLIAWIGIKAIW